MSVILGKFLSITNMDRNSPEDRGLITSQAKEVRVTSKIANMKSKQMCLEVQVGAIESRLAKTSMKGLLTSPLR